MSSKADDLFEKVTASIIRAIEAGEAGKWEKPWTTALAGTGLHINASTKRAYQGMNQLYLMTTAYEENYATPVWATYKQWEALGGQVRKGERSTELVKWGRTYVCNTDNSKGQRPCPIAGHDVTVRVWASVFHVFNVTQQDGYDYASPYADLTEPERLEHVEAFIEGTGANIRYVPSHGAYLHRDLDQITLPLRAQFETVEGFYGTALHELTHWSGQPGRLDRIMGKVFGDDNYAAEELVAELGATFLAARFGVEVVPHPEHVAYIASWLSKLKEDPKVLYRAAKQAQLATEFLLEKAGVTTSEKEEVAA